MAQDFPNRQVHIITGDPAGGGGDYLSRSVARELQQLWGQPVVVENRAGGSQSIAGQAVAQAAPDGYTIFSGTSSVLASALLSKASFKLERDLAPVALVATDPMMLLVRSSLPVHNVKELIALAQSEPGKLNYGSSGVGAATNVAGELFNEMAHVKMVQVPFKGGSQAAVALAGGEIDVDYAPYTVAPLLKTGKIRALAVTSKERLVAVPDLPAIAEDIPGYDVSPWVGMFVPAATPKDIIAKIYAALDKVINSAAFSNEFKTQGLGRVNYTTDQSRERIHNDLIQYIDMAKRFGWTESTIR